MKKRRAARYGADYSLVREGLADTCYILGTGKHRSWEEERAAQEIREPVGSETVWVPWVVTEAEREPSTLLTWSFRMEVRFSDEPFFCHYAGSTVLYLYFALTKLYVYVKIHTGVIWFWFAVDS